MNKKTSDILFSITRDHEKYMYILLYQKVSDVMHSNAEKLIHISVKYLFYVVLHIFICIPPAV